MPKAKTVNSNFLKPNSWSSTMKASPFPPRPHRGALRSQTRSRVHHPPELQRCRVGGDPSRFRNATRTLPCTTGAIERRLEHNGWDGGTAS